MYQIGEKIVHPMHGAGIIEDIVQEDFNGLQMQFYVFRMPVSGLTLKIPTHNCDLIGIREISTKKTMDGILKKVPQLSVEVTTNWNHRYRENMERLKSGDLLEVASVIKMLMQRDSERGLSTGERKMLHSAKQIMVSEIVLVKDIAYECAEKELNTLMLAGAEK